MDAMTKLNSTNSPMVKLMRTYSHYNYWANMTLIDWLRTKPSEELQKNVPSSFSGIESTLKHLWQTQEFWFDVIKDNKSDESGDNDHNSDTSELSVLLDLLVENSLAISNFVEQLDQDNLVKKVHIKSPWFESNESRFEFIMHMVNHSTYHRGQITSIGRRLGFTDAPMTDYNFYLLHQTNVF